MADTRNASFPPEVIPENDPFYSESNLRELKRRVEAIRNGTAKLEEHDLIEVD